MTDAAQIANGLTPAQRRVLIEYVEAGGDVDRFSIVIGQKNTRLTLERLGLLARYKPTAFGRAVAAELEG